MSNDASSTPDSDTGDLGSLKSEPTSQQIQDQSIPPLDCGPRPPMSDTVTAFIGEPINLTEIKLDRKWRCWLPGRCTEEMYLARKRSSDVSKADKGYIKAWLKFHEDCGYQLSIMEEDI